MPFPSEFPLLAVGGSELVSLVVFILMGIGWVIQQMSGKEQQGQPPVRRPPKPPPPRPRNDRLQDEIDIFIQEVNQQREGQPQRPAPSRPSPLPPPNPRSAAEKEAAARRRKRPEGVPPAEAGPTPLRRPPGQEIASRKAPASEDLGKGVRAHVNQYLPPGSVTKAAEQYVGDRVDQSVASHLGTFTGTAGPAAAAAAASTGQTGRLRGLLRSHGSVRQAILMNEILGKPKGLRHKSPEEHA